MRVRIKFTKTGNMKYIGHLDVMRFFQKVLRRAGLDVAYSEGFSPHMLMSFAQPLGVGVTSEGEYFDLDLKSAVSSEEMVRRINAQMPADFSVTKIVQIPEDKASKCMTLVAAADYVISFASGERSENGKIAGEVPVSGGHLLQNCPGTENETAGTFDYRLKREALRAFFSRQEIRVIKKTKRSEAEIDLKPLIYAAEVGEETLFLRLSSGSVNNVKPGLVLDTFFREQGTDPAKAGISIHRKELYACVDGAFVPLYQLGREIEG